MVDFLKFFKKKKLEPVITKEVIWVKLGKWIKKDEYGFVVRTDVCRVEIHYDKLNNTYDVHGFGTDPFFHDIYSSSINVLNFLRNYSSLTVDQSDLNQIIIEKFNIKQCNHYLPLCEKSENYEMAKLIKERLVSLNNEIK